ncbi:MAG: fructose-6-phosphate aldolase [Candidatus Sericytochromatia bacterium]|nr:fructose-6-phosphate aldolase [Candidatus Sericytochromatia bacterium]
MQLFIDTANLDEIRTAASWGVIAGVTTNPTLIAKEGRDFQAVIHEICQLIDGPISAEVIAQDAPGMIDEGRRYAAWDPHVVVKVPMTEEGIKATKALSSEGIRTNVTLCFSANQALLAALAGATYISPFVGRVDDTGGDGMALISEIREIYDNYVMTTQILTASVRSPNHVTMAAKMGSDVATCPFKILQQMFRHPLTDRGLEQFLADWASVPVLSGRA